jgi:hypothetical protein
MFEKIFQNKKLVAIIASAVALVLILALVLSLTMCNRAEPVDTSAVSDESSIVSEDSSAEESSEEESSEDSETTNGAVPSKSAGSKVTSNHNSEDNHQGITQKWQTETFSIGFSDETNEFFVTDDARIEWILEVYKNYKGPENLIVKVYDGGKEINYGYFKVGMVVKAFDGTKLLGEYTSKKIEEDVSFTFKNREAFNYKQLDVFYVYAEILIEDLINDEFAKERGFELSFYKDGIEVKSGKVSNGMKMLVKNSKKNLTKEMSIETSNTKRS